MGSHIVRVQPIEGASIGAVDGFDAYSPALCGLLMV
jgi:hypothetical protein